MDEGRWFPLFRTDAQFRVLGELFTNPDLEATIGVLAERVGAPQATVSREVARLAEAGLVRTRREGNRTLVTAAMEASIAPELQSLLGKLYGAAGAHPGGARRCPLGAAGADLRVVGGALAGHSGPSATRH